MLAACCTPTPVVNPPVVPPLEVADGGYGPEDLAEASTPCGKACLNLRKFLCAEGHTTPSGARCYDVCRSAPQLLSVDCVIAAKSLNELRACHVRCQ
jgi:hypothetical protein